MKKILIYLDNCCFNRPYDDQNFISIKIETQAKIAIQEKIKNNTIDLCWSYILDFENANNPFIERRLEIMKWKALASYDIEENQNILTNMNKFITLGLKPLDSLHISCAIELKCDYFLTVDKGILKRSGKISKSIAILSPIDLILKLENENND